MTTSGSTGATQGSRNALHDALHRLSSFWQRQTGTGKIVLSVVFLCVLSCPCLGTCALCSLTSPGSSQQAQLTPTLADEAVHLPATVEPAPTATPSATASATNTAVPTSTSTSEPTATPTATPTSSPTTAPTATPTATPTPAPVVTGPLKVHFVDVGQGDAILIQAPTGEVALIDGGEAGTGIVPYLQSQGVQRIDLMVVTHPHSDHIGGLVDVLRAMPVDEVVTNGQPHTTSIYERFLDAIMAAQAEYTEVKRGDTLQLGSLSMQVLHPVSNTGDDLNDNSIVLRLVYGDTSFLLTGDVQTSGEASMLAAGLPVSATILKVAHHASHSSSSPVFLAAVQPEVAAYSCGLGNSYGHPHAETLAALMAVGAEIYGTDVNGTVIVTTDGTGYSLATTKSGEPRSPPPAVEPTPVPAPTQLPATVAPPTDNCAYIANSNTGKFHRASCRYVDQMNPEHRVCYATRDQAIAAGYIPCKVCNP